jgi:hypothetical protein
MLVSYLFRVLTAIAFTFSRASNLQECWCRLLAAFLKILLVFVRFSLCDATSFVCMATQHLRSYIQGIGV